MTEIKEKLIKIYLKGTIFRAYIEKKEIIPIEIKLKKITQKELQENYSKTLKHIEKLKESKFPLVYKEFYFKALGKQILPTTVTFKNLNEYLESIDKLQEYKTFIMIYENIINYYPKLKELFYKKPFLILEYKDIWDKLLLVVDFFINNSHPNVYIRELSIKDIDTKFIENHKKIIDTLLSCIKETTPLNSLSNYAFEKKYHLKYPLATVRFRILDSKLYIHGLSDISATSKEFATLKIECKKVFIVENKITFLSFFDMENSIIIFGGGYGLSALKECKWLQEKELYYWGDIDEDGFAILSQIRGYFPKIRSIFMDEKTIEKFKHLKVKHNVKKSNRILDNLTKDENEVYKKLQNDFYGKNFRLEQERIPFDYIKKFLQ